MSSNHDVEFPAHNLRHRFMIYTMVRKSGRTVSRIDLNKSTVCRVRATA